jgi:hypothetical protein
MSIGSSSKRLVVKTSSFLWFLAFIFTIIHLHLVRVQFGEEDIIYRQFEDSASLCDFKSSLEELNELNQRMEQKQLSESFKRILQTNVRGIVKDENMEECVLHLKKSRAWAATLQETWKTKDNIEQHGRYMFINHGPPEKLCKRGSLGVSIVLSKSAQTAWEKAGSQTMYFGLRIIAVRLKIEPLKGKVVDIFLVSAYAPDSGKSQIEKDSYLAQLQTCIDTCKSHELLVIGTDANASVGIRSQQDDRFSGDRDNVRGPFGKVYENKAGQELRCFLGINELCLPNTFFRKRRSYDTWFSPCSKLGHQIDHFIVRQSDLKLVRDAGRTCMGMNTDHYSVMLKITVSTKRKPRVGPVVSRPPPGRINLKLLKDDEVADKFREIVTKEMKKRPTVNTTKLAHLIRAIKAAETETLLTTERRQPGWFDAAKKDIRPTLDARNLAQKAYNNKPTNDNKIKLREARKTAKRAVAVAEKTWYDKLIKNIEGMGSGKVIHPAACWKAIIELRDGKSITKPVVPMSLQKDDGTACTSPEENAAVMHKYLNEVFNQKSVFDQSAIDGVKQRCKTTFAWLDQTPTHCEISAAIFKMGDGKSGAETKVNAEHYKALAQDDETMKFLEDVIVDFWQSGSYKEMIPEPPKKVSKILASKRVSKPTFKVIAAAIMKQPKFAKDKISNAKHSNCKINFAKVNPRTKGSQVFGRFALYSVGSTINEAIELGASLNDLKTDLEKGYLTILDNVFDKPVDTDVRDPDADKDGRKIEEWSVARLKLLPKKGNLALPKNWRGICLLDIASKVMSSVVVARMAKVQEHEGLEAQTGFRSERGPIDGSFNTNIGIQKRKEHGLPTWAAFIDLVKAFDTVSREALFQILRKFGMPDHFINIVIRLHVGSVIKVKVGEVEVEVPSTIGVRQGSCEGPSLFLFIMQACMETAEWPVPKPQFCTVETGPITGARSSRKRNVTTFDLWSSLFADDCALLFESRSDLIEGTNYIFHHLQRFGLLMHIGKGDTASKTEAVFFPGPGQTQSDGDTSNFDVADGFVSFTTEFRYLGSTLVPLTPTSTNASARQLQLLVSCGRASSLTRISATKTKALSMWLSVSLYCYMGVSVGVLLRNCSTNCVPFTTSVFGLCVVLL